jgi:hypothetical protein
MNHRQFSLARIVVLNLIKHPCCTSFRNQLDPLPSRYQSFPDWVSSVQSVFSPPKGSPAQLIIIAGAMEKIFTKELRKAHLFADLSNWSDEISRVRNRLGELVYSPPRQAMAAFSGFDAARPIRSQLQSDSDYRLFLEAAQMLTNLDDQEALMKLIETEQPELTSNEAKVDISLLTLRPTTFVKARELVKQKLRLQHIDYPSFFS